VFSKNLQKKISIDYDDFFTQMKGNNKKGAYTLRFQLLGIILSDIGIIRPIIINSALELK
jgi:uncharacterized protein VirK/YbjX